MAGGSSEETGTCRQCHAAVAPGAAFCPDCGAPSAPGPAPGPDLAGYTILRVIGHGGAADVYLARQESLERLVAVKVLRHDVHEPKVWARFQREARMIARLSGHANVVTVYTAGRSDAGQPCLVTEYLDRGSLGDVIAAEGPLPPGIVAQLGIAVADALTAAHGLGILHRDVKPGNVLLDHDGRVKLGDFGISRLVAAQSITTTDVVAFTPEHVAPEVLRGEADGPSSDVYGLGSTLAAALLGGALFTRGPDERVEALLSRKLTGPPPDLPVTVPELLASVVMRTLDPDPARRPSLAEVRHQLAAAGGAPGSTAPMATIVAKQPPLPSPDVRATPLPSPVLRPLRAQRRRRRALLVVPVLLLALALAALGVAVLAGGFGREDEASNDTALAPTSAPAVSSGAAAGTPTAPPTAASAPATTLAPVAVPAPAPDTAAQTTPPPAADAVLTTPAEVETFIRSYYAIVEAGDYEASWPRLAPEFQEGRARSFEYYAGFWDDNDAEVGDIDVVTVTENQAVVEIELFLNGSERPVDEELTLRAGEEGRLLIAEERPLDE